MSTDSQSCLIVLAAPLAMYMYTCSLRKRRRLSRPSPQPPLLPTHLANGHGATDSNSPIRSRWSLLAPELLVQIFTHLTTPGDRRSAMLVCRSWKEAMNTKSLWKRKVVCLRRVPTTRPRDWSILQSRDVKKFILRSNLETVVSLLSNLLECAPELTSLQLEITENYGFVQKPGSVVLSSLGKFSCVTEVVLVGERKQSFTGLQLMLQKLTNLEELSLLRLNPGSLDPSVRCRAEKLHTLQFQQIPTLTSLQTTILVNMCPKLNTLRIQGCSYAKERVFLKTSTVTKSGVSLVKNLSLANTLFDGEEVRIPYRFKSLESLDLSSCQQSEPQLLHLLEQLTNLRELILSGNECTGVVLSKMSCELVSLELKRCVHVSSHGIRCLVETCGDSLERLNLAHCTRVDVSLLESFPRLFPRLSYLDLSGWRALTPGNLKPLQTMGDLRKLVLHSVDNALALKQALDAAFRRGQSKIIACVQETL